MTNGILFDQMKIDRESGFQFIKYLFLGGIGAATDTILFALMVSFGIDTLLGNTLSTLAGILVSYSLNTKYTFSQQRKIDLSLVRFLLVGLFGLVLSNLCLWMLVEKMALEPITAKIFILPFIALIQYILNKYWTFNMNTN